MNRLFRSEARPSSVEESATLTLTPDTDVHLPAARDPARLAEDRRLATLHLRLGAYSLARAELERLGGRGELGPAGLADLAEARWRGGELDAAATAAVDHLAAGGSRPIARVIAAEAAAAAGRPAEARVHVDALGAVNASALDLLFAGMPRRAFWPSVPATRAGGPDTLFGGTRTGSGTDLRRVAPGIAGAAAPTAGPGGAGATLAPHPQHPGGSELPGEEPQLAGLWADEEAAAAAHGFGIRRLGSATPLDELATARAELGAGNAGAAVRGLTRLGLVLRLDPALALAVLDAVGPRRDVAALLLRGDAYRLLGRHLDAEAAFAAAARALDGPDGPNAG